MSAKTYTVKRVVRHKNFDINTLFHDVAVLSLAQDINYDYSVQSICLDRQASHNYEGTTVQVAGWGATSAGSSTRGAFTNDVRKFYLGFRTPSTLSLSLTFRHPRVV